MFLILSNSFQINKKIWPVSFQNQAFHSFRDKRSYYSRKQVNSNLSSLHLVMVEKLKTLQLFYKRSLYVLDIKVTLNNIYITITTYTGKVLIVGSGGLLKLKNSKRNTTYILQLLLISILKKLKKKKITILILKVYNLKKKYRKVLLKYLQLYRLKLLYISTISAKSYNGVRLKKKRRV